MNLTVDAYLDRVGALVTAAGRAAEDQSPIRAAARLRDRLASAVAEGDERTARAIVLFQDVALRTGEDAVQNAVLLGFLEDAAWEAPPLHGTWSTWPPALRAALAKQQAAVEDAIRYERESLRGIADREAGAGDTVVG